MNHPNLQDFGFLLFRELRYGLWKLVVIDTPICVVQGMDCREMTVVVGLAMVQDHGYWSVACIGDFNPVVGERNVCLLYTSPSPRDA